MSKTKKQTVGIIGRGFVGNAVAEGLKHAFDVQCYDTRQELTTTASIKHLCSLADVVFVCVPTPMKQTGQCDISIIESVIAEINRDGNCTTVVIKSTVPPGTTEMLNNKFANSCRNQSGISAILFNPEFLTEANAVNDFKQQDRIILGAPEHATLDSSNVAASRLDALYETAYPHVKRVWLNTTEAELVKYVTNCYLAMKVSYSNELYQICQKIGISYGNVIDAATLDERLGKSFWKVPGPVLVDGKPAFGFGLSCFPKDINSLIFKAKELGVNPTMLEAVWQKNLEVRPQEQRDWEKMEKAFKKS